MNTGKQIKRIGRTLGQSAIANMIDAGIQSRVFTLKSGKTATFTMKHIAHSDITELTYVDPQINGRDQSTLTEASVSDISRTIGLQQFFPAIGRMQGGRIEIMDGLRRRAACIYTGAGLDVLVTADELDMSDARQLAADIQTAKEHNLRELGLRFMLMYENGMSKGDIAKVEGMSAAKVSRAFMAASVPSEIIDLFPVVSELTLSNYQLLLEVTDEAKAEGVDIQGMADTAREQLSDILTSETVSVDEQKAEVLKCLRAMKRQIKGEDHVRQ